MGGRKYLSGSVTCFDGLLGDGRHVAQVDGVCARDQNYCEHGFEERLVPARECTSGSGGLEEEDLKLVLNERCHE